MSTSVASALGEHLTPAWSVVPFAVYLLSMAVLPLVAGHLWESTRTKLIVAAVAGAPVVGYLLGGRHGGGGVLLHTTLDYLSFISLLGALFTISGGICLRGSLAGTPLVNTAFLTAGAVLGSIIGTTGASALLIRPLLRANERRHRRAHLVVFFIFIVSNSAGLLTPLGDPPLFLGFLRGVPFAWTLRLLPAWALVNGVLILLFVGFDWIAFELEGRSRSTALAVHQVRDPLRLEGTLNLAWLLGIVAIALTAGFVGPTLLPSPALRSTVQAAGMLGFAALSWLTTPPEVRNANRFTWSPIVEVAVVFAGIFLTMAPALSFLEERGAAFGIVKPWQFFWASGALSSVLDNAPTYLTFASLASGIADEGRGLLSAADLGGLAADPVGQHLLAAISCGAVLMGAVTYIGNGPNFMVKAIAEQHHVRTPSFFAYTIWSGAILLPLFAVVTRIFF